jgi:2',3'-cyclic-nucleotide 2'-phosphodiesterase (5'-nucleotidase family)
VHKNQNEAKGTFANYLVTTTLTGAQTETLLEQQITPLGTDRGRLLQVSNGFTYACDFTSASKRDRARRRAVDAAG